MYEQDGHQTMTRLKSFSGEKPEGGDDVAEVTEKLSEQKLNDKPAGEEGEGG